MTNDSVFLSEGFEAKGETRHLGAKIGGQLLCNGGSFLNDRGHAFLCQDVKVSGPFFWQNVQVEKGSVDLRATITGPLSDDIKSWPAEIYLDGFEYSAIIAAPTSWRERIAWLGKQREFNPQPYEHLAKVLRAMGHEHDARKIAIAKQEELRKSGWYNWKGWLWNVFWGLPSSTATSPGGP